MQVVTSDADGNLATFDASSLLPDLAGSERRLDKQQDQIETHADGIAIALALGGTYLPLPKAFAVSTNMGAFEGSPAFGLTAIGRLSENWTFNGGVGIGSNRYSVAVRIGVTYAWWVMTRPTPTNHRRLLLVGAAGLVLYPLGSADADDVAATASREDAELIGILMRSSLLALHHANVTGNYTVLRDLGAPAFRTRNTAADLATIFSPIRAREIDIETVAILQPRLDAPPKITNGRLLAISGALDTLPVRVEFDMEIQLVDGAWKIFGLSLAPDDDEPF